MLCAYWLSHLYFLFVLCCEIDCSHDVASQMIEEQGVLGSTMMFVVLKELAVPHMDEFSERIRLLAQTGGVTVNCFKMESNKIVVTLNRGWTGIPLFYLLLEQPEVESVEWRDKELAIKQPDARKLNYKNRPFKNEL